jgi:hypothetical protein
VEVELFLEPGHALQAAGLREWQDETRRLCAP